MFASICKDRDRASGSYDESSVEDDTSHQCTILHQGLLELDRDITYHLLHHAGPRIAIIPD